MGKKKKNKKTVSKPVEKKIIVEEAEVQQTEIKPVKSADETVASTKDKPKKPKKERKSRLVRRLKETGSELKKVTWPTFPKVVKQTGVVLAVVLFFGLVLFGFDYLLKFLFELLVG